jgi:uncharacterized membrane protein
MGYEVTGSVEAPADAVWKLFIDVERWPELTTSISEARRTDSGPLRVGSEAVIKQPGLPEARWRVTELDEGRSFSWETKAGLVTAVGGHQVTADGPAAVITLTLTQRGPLAGLVQALTGRLARKNLALELEGFRRGAASAQA